MSMETFKDSEDYFDSAEESIIILFKNFSKYSDVIDSILKSGKVDFNFKIPEFGTLLHLVISQNHDFNYIFEEILDYSKTNFEAKNNFGKSILHFCVAKNKINYVKSILEKTEVCINTTDKNGSTPLIDAALIKNDDIITLLLKYGADPDISIKIGTKMKTSLIINLENRVIHEDLIMKTNFNNPVLIEWINNYNSFNIYQENENIISIISNKISVMSFEEVERFINNVFFKPIVYNAHPEIEGIISQNVMLKKIIDMVRTKLRLVW